MKKLLGIVAASAFAITAISAPAAAKPAGVGEGAPPAGIACQQEGIATLQSLEFDGKPLLATVAKSGVEVLDASMDSLGVVPLREVLRLHRTAPELFQTGGVYVVLPAELGGVTAATWCNV